MSGMLNQDSTRGCGSLFRLEAHLSSLEQSKTEGERVENSVTAATSDFVVGGAFGDQDWTKPPWSPPYPDPLFSLQAVGDNQMEMGVNAFLDCMPQNPPYDVNITLSDPELIQSPVLTGRFTQSVPESFWGSQDCPLDMTVNEAGHKNVVTGSQSSSSQVLFREPHSGNTTTSISRKHKRSIDSSQEAAGPSAMQRTVDCAHILKLIFKNIPHPSFQQLDEFARAMELSFKDVSEVYQSIQYSPANSSSDPSSQCRRDENFANTDTDLAHTTSTKDSAYWSLTSSSIIATPPSKQIKTDKRLSEVRMPTKVRKQIAKEKKFQCTQANCSMWFRRRADRDRHFKSHFPNDLECPVENCTRKFNRKDKVQEHMKKDHPDIKIVSVPNDEDGQDPDRSDGPGSGDHDRRSRSYYQEGFSFSYSGGNGGLGGATGLSSSGGYITQYSGSNKSDNKACEMEQMRLLNYSSFLGHQSFSYDFIRYLGRGAYAVVDAVRITSGSKGINMIVARKTVRVSPKQALNLSEVSHEIATMKLLNHPNIVKLISSHVFKNRLCINMIPVAHCDLAQYMSCQMIPLSLPATEQLGEAVIDLSSALAYLHSNDVRHGDIKPENILVDYKFKMLLTDFGCARIYTSNTLVAEKIPFTPKYCAPEVYRQEPPGLAADVFSLGCVFTEISTILCNKTLATLGNFLVSDGVKSPIRYHAIVHIIVRWLESLAINNRRIPKKYLVLQTIINMLHETPSERPTADALYNRLTALRKSPNWLKTSHLHPAECSSMAPATSESIVYQIQKCSQSIERRFHQETALDFHEKLKQVDKNPPVGSKSTLEIEKWIFDIEAFERWASTPGENLWIRGNIGNGKMLLCSIVINHLTERCQNPPLYFFFTGPDTGKKSATSFLRDTILRLLAQPLAIPDKVTNPVKNSRHTQPHFTLQDICHAILLLIEKSRQTLLIIDALDEYGYREREPFYLTLFQTKAPRTINLTLLITGQEESDDMSLLTNGLRHVLSVESGNPNADVYIKGPGPLRLPSGVPAPGDWVEDIFVERCGVLGDEIEDLFVKRARGM